MNELVAIPIPWEHTATGCVEWRLIEYDTAIWSLGLRCMRSEVVVGRNTDLGCFQSGATTCERCEVNPRFGPAANNLVYLYSEYGGDKEKTLQLAQTAKEVLPEDLRISDTLGWILYKRGIYERAVSLLRESAEKLEDNTEVQYHLGMAYLKTGNPQAAKDSLANALKLSESFTGVEEAKRVLADLN